MMRGLAPLVTTAIAAVTLREVPGASALIGVLALVVGVAAMGLSGLAHRRIDRATLVVALCNSIVIAIYTVIDGEGARLAGPNAAHVFAYNAWSDGLTAALYLPVVLALRGKAAGPEFVRDPLRSAFAGLAAFGGYAIVIWATTQAPIGAVAALRECSVVFAAIIGVAFLSEPFRGARAGAALLIVGGVIALRLA
jgi:drug/metabolite transporter (DMT)-like permease